MVVVNHDYLAIHYQFEVERYVKSGLYTGTLLQMSAQFPVKSQITNDNTAKMVARAVNEGHDNLAILIFIPVVNHYEIVYGLSHLKKIKFRISSLQKQLKENTG